MRLLRPMTAHVLSAKRDAITRADGLVIARQVGALPRAEGGQVKLVMVRTKMDLPILPFDARHDIRYLCVFSKQRSRRGLRLIAATLWRQRPHALAGADAHFDGFARALCGVWF